MRKIMTRRFFICVLFAFSAIFSSFAQSLPEGYASVRLGMSVEQVKKELKNDPQFGYRGDRDVSMLPGQDKVLIETDTSRTNPLSYLDRCWFQFYDGKLYIITININKDKMDHYSVFSTLCKKYGNPQTLNPEKSEWKDGRVMMSLERPLALKYTDQKVFEELQNKAKVQETIEEERKEDFLNSL